MSTIRSDARVLAAPRVAGPMLLASLVVVTGHVVTFALAARAVGVRAERADLVEVCLVVLLVGALPLNLAGWGPREGAAAWAFAAAGEDPSTGLAVAVAYGTIVWVAAAPGAALLVVGAVRRWQGAVSSPAPGPATNRPVVGAPARRGGAGDG